MQCLKFASPKYRKKRFRAKKNPTLVEAVSGATLLKAFSTKVGKYDVTELFYFII